MTQHFTSRTKIASICMNLNLTPDIVCSTNVDDEETGTLRTFMMRLVVTTFSNKEVFFVQHPVPKLDIF